MRRGEKTEKQCHDESKYNPVEDVDVIMDGSF